MRRAVLLASVAMAGILGGNGSASAAGGTADPIAVMTDEVMDLYVYEPICGYSIHKEKLDIYLLGTPMFWGEPVSQGEIEEARARQIALIGTNERERSRRCRRVTDTFGPTGRRARGIAR